MGFYSVAITPLFHSNTRLMCARLTPVSDHKIINITVPSIILSAEMLQPAELHVAPYQICQTQSAEIETSASLYARSWMMSNFTVSK